MTPHSIPADGLVALPPRELWTDAARRRRDAYAITPGAPFLKTEFGYYCWEQWKQQGMPDIKEWSPEAKALLHYDDSGGTHGLWNLGWCEPQYVPEFEVKILEDRG